MYLPDHAAANPDKPAIISADTGQVVTFKELNDASNRMAQLLHARGLRRGDHLAILMENNLHFMEPVWAGFRSGLYVTTVNRYLPADEAAYIVNDCGASAIVTSYEEPLAASSPEPLAEEWLGDSMLYSSGTTGRPKGILRPLPQHTAAEGFKMRQMANVYGYSPETVYLSPAPLYHAAPLSFVLG